MQEEVKIAQQWLAKANNDLLNADNNLNRYPMTRFAFIVSKQQKSS